MKKALSAFLSHSNLDEPQVKIVQRFLNEIGIKPWVSYDNIHHSEYDEVIARQIETNDIFVLILTTNSANSRKVRGECIFADDLENKVFAVYELEKIGKEKMPAGLKLRLAGKQHILTHKYPNALERLAQFIFTEKGLKWEDYSDKVEEVASRIRREILEAKMDRQRKLHEYKELYWNCRTRYGKHRDDSTITVNERNQLNEEKERLGLSDQDVSRVRSGFDRRKKADFTKIFNSTLNHAILTREDLYQLERKRIGGCVSKNEVKKAIDSRNRIPPYDPGFRLGVQNDKPVEIPINIDWIIESLDRRRKDLNPTKAPTSSGPNEEPDTVSLNTDKPTKEVTTKHSALKPDSNAVDIQVVKVRAAYRGCGKNDDFFGLQEIKHSQDSSSNLDASFILHVTSQEASTGLTRIIIASLAGDEEKLYVKIPSNIRSGTQLRLKGKGHKVPCKKRGDLFLKIKVYDAPLEDLNKPFTALEDHASTGISQSAALDKCKSATSFPKADIRKSDCNNLAQDGFPSVELYGVAKTFECNDGFMVITEIYLGNHINKLSVRRIDIDKSSFTFHGVSDGSRQNVIKTTRAFNHILVQRNKIYFKQDGFRNLIKAQIEPAFEDYPRLLEFLKSSLIPVKEIDENQRDEINSITSSSQDRQPTFMWDWLRNVRDNTNATREVIHEQNSQKPDLDELSAFDLMAAFNSSLGKLDGIPEIKFGADISDLPAVKSAIKAFNLKNEKDLKTFFWYNDSIIRRKRGIIIFNRGISLQSFFQNPTLFIFGRHDFRLSDNIAISDQNNELRIEISGYTNTSSEPEQKSYVLTSPDKEQRPLIAAALTQFVGIMDSYYSCISRLRSSLARELRCSNGYRDLSTRAAISTYSPPDQLSSLDEFAKDLLSLSKLSLPSVDELIFVLRPPVSNASLILATIRGLYAAKKFGKKLAKGVFISWSLLHDFKFCAKNDNYHFFQINDGVDVFTVSWLLADGSKDDLVEIARFVMTLKKRLSSIVHL